MIMSTYLRYMLVQRMRQVRDAIHITPSETIWEVRCFQISMWKGTFHIVVNSIWTNLSCHKQKCRHRVRDKRNTYHFRDVILQKFTLISFL